MTMRQGGNGYVVPGPHPCFPKPIPILIPSGYGFFPIPVPVGDRVYPPYTCPCLIVEVIICIPCSL